MDPHAFDQLLQYPVILQNMKIIKKYLSHLMMGNV